jgi:hypothetical protein
VRIRFTKTALSRLPKSGGRIALTALAKLAGQSAGTSTAVTLR